jgi:hypothetical protein
LPNKFKFKFNDDQRVVDAVSAAYHTGKLPVNRPILSGRDSGNLRTTLVTMLLLLSTLTKIQSIILDV